MSSFQWSVRAALCLVCSGILRGLAWHGIVGRGVVG